MSDPDARRRQAERLREAIARGDLAAASELLDEARGGRMAPGPPGPALPDEPPGEPPDEVEAPDAPAPAPRAEPAPLEAACPGGPFAVRTFDRRGECYRLAGRLEEAVDGAREAARQYAAVLRGARQRFDDDAGLAASPAMCHLADAGPGDVLLAAAAATERRGGRVFLISTARLDGGGLGFEQWLARTPGEEAAVLTAFVEAWLGARLVATFPDSGGDFKTLTDAIEAAEIELPRPRRRPPHLDLRRELRARWKQDIRRFRPASLERLLTGRPGGADVGPAEAREAWERFLATADASGVAAVVGAHRRELVTLSRLVVMLLTGCGPAVA